MEIIEKVCAEHAVDTVLFDYDGTLMDTNQVIMDSWKHTFLKILGREPTEAEIYSTYGEMMWDTMRRLFGGTDEEIMSYIRIYIEYNMQHYNEGIRLFEGTADMLQRLRKKGYTLCLVTSRTAESACDGLREFGVYDYFHDFVTAEDTRTHKPNPEPVLTALKKLGKTPDQAVMLGDTWFDMECASRAGVSTVLVGWSKAYWYRHDRTSGHPDHIIRKPGDMVDLMQELNKR